MCVCVYMYNLDTLKEHFEVFGEVEEITIMRDRLSGSSRGFGFVTFVDQISADAATAKKSQQLDGRYLDIKPAVPKGQMSHG